MPTNYKCLSCVDEPEFSKEELKSHLIKVHSLSEPFAGKRKCTLFLDGAKGYHEQHYEWTIGEVKVGERWTSR